MKNKFTPPKNFTIGILGNVEKISTCETALELIRILEERGINFYVQKEISEQMRIRCGLNAGKSSVQASDVPGKSDVIVSLGGDGTILRTAKTVGESGKPILGVNLGKLGFLAELNFDELRKSIDGLLKGEFNLEERTVLKASFGRGKKASSVFALNDVVIDKAGSPRMIDLETYVDSEYLITYRADGIVISTPTGSTGYCLSTGGPIITMETRVIAISPISPHTLSARPVIVPDSSEIRIVVRSAYKHVMLAADGQVSSVQAPPAEFAVSLAPHRITLLRKSTNGFFGLLRSKLMWGVDIRSSEEYRTGEEKE
ncbi:MAG: NAD(+)/NADH kinase [Bacteroidetes bacterium]|nr:NAD(+)/NADH kinase [Bacteroidota bacterium]